MSSDAFHITQPSEDGDGAVRVMTNAIKDAGIRAARGRLHQRSWHFDLLQRQARDDGDQESLRRFGLFDSGQLDEVDDGAFARSGRRRRGRHHRAGVAAIRSCRRLPTTRSPTPNAISIMCRMQRGAWPMRICAVELLRVRRNKRGAADEAVRRDRRNERAQIGCIVGRHRQKIVDADNTLVQ